MRTPCAKNPELWEKWRVLGRKRPCCKMFVILPTGPVWPALMWTMAGGGGGGTSRWRWKASVCFFREGGNGDVVEMEEVILL